MDESYFKPQIQLLLNGCRKAIPQLTILEPGGEYEEIRKRQLLDTARLLGFGEERLKRLEEVLARAKNVDEAVEEFKKLKREQEDPPEQNSIKIVKGEEDLIKHLQQGWTLSKVLNHNKYLAKIIVCEMRKEVRRVVESYNERDLFKLEKKIVNECKDFSNLNLKPIKIADSDEFDGQADEDAIKISTNFLKRKPSMKELEDLLKHELIHYLHPGHGHSIEFIEQAKRLGVTVEYRNLIEVNKTLLEGRIKWKINMNGVEEVTIGKHPSWKGFKESLERFYLPPGIALKELRNLYDVSAEDLAEKIGITSSQLQQIEKSDDISLLYCKEKLLKTIFQGITSSKIENK